ncbi:hypothetical protein DFH06DRAFT_1127796 [Mycena polygramma]|nr:hypothetical protein DFH06DRAFT_1127796 [Mycena polygramma]
MPSDALTPAEIAQIMGNTSTRLSAAEMDGLLGSLSDGQLDEVLDIMGLGELARQLPPVLLKVLLVYQRKLADKPPEYDDEIDSLIRAMDTAEFLRNPPSTLPPRATPSASAPRATPSTSAPRATPSASAPRATAMPRGTPSTPSTPAPRGTPSAPSTPTTPRRPANTPRSGYDVVSPAKTGHVVSWLEAGALTQGVRGAAAKKIGGRSHAARPRPGAYAVFYGGQIGPFLNWADVQRSITCHGPAIHCGFPNFEAATAAIDYARARGWTGDSTVTAPSTPLPLPSSYEENPLNCGPQDLWYAVCRGVAPGVYRSYLECALNTVGVPGNLCRSFETKEEAETAYTSAFTAGFTRTSDMNQEFVIQVTLVTRRHTRRPRRSPRPPQIGQSPACWGGDLGSSNSVILNNLSPLWPSEARNKRMMTNSQNGETFPYTTYESDQSTALPSLSTAFPLRFYTNLVLPCSKVHSPLPPAPKANHIVIVEPVATSTSVDVAAPAQAYSRANPPSPTCTTRLGISTASIYRNREKINERARIRMRRKREELANAPSAVQLDYSVRAARRVQLGKKTPAKMINAAPASPQSTPPSSPKQTAPPPEPTIGAPRTPALRRGKNVGPSIMAPNFFHLPPPRCSKPRIPEPVSPTPRSLAHIANSLSDDDTDGSADWDADDEGEKLPALFSEARRRR